MRDWKGFTTEQVTVLWQTIPPPGATAGTLACPSCGHPGVRWYSYRNPWRPNSVLYYIWCPSCARFHGEKVFVPGWNLTDPLELSSREERLTMESDIDSYFSTLDGLWDAGELPQAEKSEE